MEIGDHLEKQKPGWLLPYLLTLDTLDVDEPDEDLRGPMPFHGHGRWDYWLDACLRGQVPEGDIPRIEFEQTPERVDSLHIREMLRFYVQKYGSWYDDAWLQMVRWLLHGFGRKGLEKEVERIPAEIRNFWYTQFNLAHLLHSPCDWSACLLESRLHWMKPGTAKWSKSTGFFSTPTNVCKMMTEMALGITDPEEAKISTVCDPCCGTGSMLLPASNHSLRLYGVDIVYDLVLCAELNGWLWMPWMVFSTKEMDETFVSLDEQRGNGHTPQGVRLETRPERVEATQAYRNGEIDQGDFFARLGM